LRDVRPLDLLLEWPLHLNGFIWRYLPIDARKRLPGKTIYEWSRGFWGWLVYTTAFVGLGLIVLLVRQTLVMRPCDSVKSMMEAMRTIDSRLTTFPESNPVETISKECLGCGITWTGMVVSRGVLDTGDSKSAPTLILEPYIEEDQRPKKPRPKWLSTHARAVFDDKKRLEASPFKPEDVQTTQDNPIATIAVDKRWKVTIEGVLALSVLTSRFEIRGAQIIGREQIDYFVSKKLAFGEAIDYINEHINDYEEDKAKFYLNYGAANIGTFRPDFVGVRPIRVSEWSGILVGDVNPIAREIKILDPRFAIAWSGFKPKGTAPCAVFKFNDLEPESMLLISRLKKGKPMPAGLTLSGTIVELRNDGIHLRNAAIMQK